MRTLAPGELWTAEASAAADRHTMDTLGMPSPVLMERAALCVSAEVERVADAAGADAVWVLCGPGNNGGDGLAVARQLEGRGRRVRAVLVTEKHNEAVAQQLALARSHGVEVVEALPEPPGQTTVIVDAMLGTGSKGAPRGGVAKALDWLVGLGREQAPVVAVDLPSGVDVDSGAVPAQAVPAVVTVTFQRSKPGLHLTPARGYVGEVVVADIGLVAPPDRPASAVALIDPRRVAELLTGLPRPSHKGRRGHVGVIGGSGGTPGAAILAGAAAMRAGAGLVTLGASDPQLRRDLIELRPELMLALPEDAEAIPHADVLVVGPGLTDPDSRAGLDELDREDDRPMVWDASALDELGTGGRPSAGPRILTPHPGEAARMLGRLDTDSAAEWSNQSVQDDRRHAARRLAELTGAVVVLKGEGSVVADPEGRLAICTTGGPALASAGSGDVLAGACAAMFARGLGSWDAACVAVHLHGLAGDRAAANGTLAMDIADGFKGAMACASEAAGQGVPGRWPAWIQG